MFGCISSSAWYYDESEKKEVCIMNRSASACHFATFVGVIAFAAAIALIVGEWFFEQMSSVRTQTFSDKHLIPVRSLYIYLKSCQKGKAVSELVTI